MVFKKIIRKPAENFFAGPSRATATRQAEKNLDKKVKTVVNKFGEHYKERDKCIRDKEEYLKLHESLVNKRIMDDVSVSVKPTQLGLDIDEDFFFQNFEDLVEEYRKVGLALDMESSEYVDPTIKAIKLFDYKSDNLSICLQAYLKRTKEDLEELSEFNQKVRLVKGAYREDSKISYKGKKIDQNYLDCVKYMLSDEFNCYPAIATHDKNIIDEVKQLSQDKTNFEFQMLMGVRENLQKELVKEGYNVRQYVPYGEEWFPYFYRRFKEKPSYFIFALRNFY